MKTKLPKNFEGYARYEKSNIFPNETSVVIDRLAFKMIAEAAGLYLHRPDKGTGVVVVHGYKDRNDPRQYSAATNKRVALARRKKKGAYK